MRLEPVNHVEQGIGRFLLVRQDVGLNAVVHRGPVIEPGTHIGRAAGLPALANDDPHLAGAPLLILEPLVDVLLRPIEPQRLKHTVFRQDLEHFGGKQGEIGSQRRQPLQRRIIGLHSPLPATPSSRFNKASIPSASPECSIAFLFG